MSTGDQARASVLVEVPPAEAFAIFTEEIDQWWRHGRKFRAAGRRRSVIHLEPGVGGRLFESFDKAGGGTQVLQTGEVTDWDPPRLLRLRWRNVNFAPREHTEVEVVFAESPSGTLVTVTHRGWAEIRPDHPARHGQPVPEFIRMMGLWWGDLLTSLRYRAQAKNESRS